MKRLIVVASLAAACGGTTGSALVTFNAAASGPADAAGGPLTFTTRAGAQITLTKASLHIGAVYLNQSRPASGAATEPCILPGIYVAEALGPLDVDLLSPAPQPFPATGEGIQTQAVTAEIWLSSSHINALNDAPVILDVAGTAIQAGQTVPFTSQVTIGARRLPTSTTPAQPSANPICHQRIVTPIRIDITPTNHGTLALRIDPRPMFDTVDFSTAVIPAGGTTYSIPDDGSQAGEPLFKGMVANSGVYSFTWKEQ